MSEWIRVEDGLSLADEWEKPPKPVLTYDAYGQMQVACCSQDDDGCVTWYDADDVTHWRRLPEPPKT